MVLVYVGLAGNIGPMKQSVIQVDAFTKVPFKGNPAAVCILPGPAEEKWMQLVAREMNLSETAFLYRDGEHYQLRWFTPTTEVDLCGHATLASAHILYEDAHVARDETIRFQCASGELLVLFANGRLEMDFPSLPTRPCDPPESMLDALGVKPKAVQKGRFDYLVEVATTDEVRSCSPDFGLLRTLGIRGVIVTAQDGNDFDFISRFFAPGAGIDEDPVTGSAHCSLAPYWAVRLNKTELTAYQASERGGQLWLRLNGDRVGIAGHAVTIMRAEMNFA